MFNIFKAIEKELKRQQKIYDKSGGDIIYLETKKHLSETETLKLHNSRVAFILSEQNISTIKRLIEILNTL